MRVQFIYHKWYSTEFFQASVIVIALSANYELSG